MPEGSDPQRKFRPAADGALRAWREHRWLMATALLSIVGAALASGSALVLAFALPVLAAGALLPPLRSAERGAVDSGKADPGLGGLTAERLAAAVSDPLIVFDRTGAIVHANDAARAVFGALPPGAALQLKFRAPEMQELFQSVLGRKDGVTTIDYLDKVPVERLYRVSVTPVGGASGLYVLGFRDQSEARRIDRMRADFIANASHELRTPLASVSGFIETLRGPARNDPAAREKFLQIMQEQTGRMARLIDDLLSLSRLEMKPLAAAGERVDLGALLQSVVDTLGHVAAESGVAIEKRIEDSPLLVAGSRDELFQVFENLLENACKYGQSGGQVIVSAEKASGEVRATVTDFGPGIPSEHIPRITERFYRVDVETSRAQKGTGLGLSIVKHILTRHRARLTIRSELGKGASFTVHFPAE